MAVTIGHASLDENGRTTGGNPGDQNGKEVSMRYWYAKGFTTLLRPKDKMLAERSAKACEAACRNDNIGYSQARRNTLHIEAKKVGYDLGKIGVPCETDCSAFMTVCAIAGGAGELEYSGNAPTTSTMVNAFVKSGRYEMFTDDRYLTTDENLLRGDILVKPGSHTAMVLTDGASTGRQNPKAIDISKYNQITNYRNLRAAGVKYAVIKAVEKNGNVEPSFERHYHGCLNAGIDVMCVYNYSYATTVEEAKRDAKAVVKALNGRMIPVALDVEDKCQQGLGVLLIDIIRSYQRVVECVGLPFVLYTGLSFYKNYLLPFKNLLGEQQMWIARYPSTKTMSITDNPSESMRPNVQGMFMWQYSSTVSIPNACKGNLDCNIVYAPIVKRNKTGKVGKVKEGISSLRIRLFPSMDGEVVGHLNAGDDMTSYAVSNGWHKISPDRDEWVSGDYLEF